MQSVGGVLVAAIERSEVDRIPDLAGPVIGERGVAETRPPVLEEVRARRVPWLNHEGERDPWPPDLRSRVRMPMSATWRPLSAPLTSA